MNVNSHVKAMLLRRSSQRSKVQPSYSTIIQHQLQGLEKENFAIWGFMECTDFLQCIQPDTSDKIKSTCNQTAFSVLRLMHVTSGQTLPDRHVTVAQIISYNMDQSFDCTTTDGKISFVLNNVTYCEDYKAQQAIFQLMISYPNYFGFELVH
jgi:hypothetical protein